MCQEWCWGLWTNIHCNPATWRLIYAPTIASCLDYVQAAQLGSLIPQLCLPVDLIPPLPMDTTKRDGLALRVNFGH